MTKTMTKTERMTMTMTKIKTLRDPKKITVLFGNFSQMAEPPIGLKNDPFHLFPHLTVCSTGPIDCVKCKFT